MPDLCLKPWDQTEPGDVLVVVDGYEDFLAGLRQRKEALGFSNEEIDERAGLTRGHYDKVFGPRRKFNLGGLSFGLFLAALGLKVALVVDRNPTPVIMKDRTNDRSKWRPGEELPPGVAA